MKTYLEASQEGGKAMFQQGVSGAVVMLNMLRFKTEADYSGLEKLDPGKSLSGKEAYQLYIDNTIPFLEKAGSEVLFYGKSSSFLIGPLEEKWDAVLLVRHASIQEFVAFAQNEEYLAIAGHRTAALEDSRLLPIEQGEIQNI